MRNEIILPQLAFAMEEGKLIEWLAKEGQPVKPGDILYTLETDKAVQEIEADGEGRLRIIKAEGETYPVGTVLGIIE